jgi:hypothetical protein
MRLGAIKVRIVNLWRIRKIILICITIHSFASLCQYPPQYLHVPPILRVVLAPQVLQRNIYQLSFDFFLARLSVFGIVLRPCPFALALARRWRKTGGKIDNKLEVD